MNSKKAVTKKRYTDMTMDQFKDWDQHVKQARAKGEKWLFPDQFLEVLPQSLMQQQKSLTR